MTQAQSIADIDPQLTELPNTLDGVRDAIVAIYPPLFKCCREAIPDLDSNDDTIRLHGTSAPLVKSYLEQLDKIHQRERELLDAETPEEETERERKKKEEEEKLQRDYEETMSKLEEKWRKMKIEGKERNKRSLRDESTERGDFESCLREFEESNKEFEALKEKWLLENPAPGVRKQGI